MVNKKELREPADRFGRKKRGPASKGAARQKSKVGFILAQIKVPHDFYHFLILYKSRGDKTLQEYYDEALNAVCDAASNDPEYNFLATYNAPQPASKLLNLWLKQTLHDRCLQVADNNVVSLSAVIYTGLIKYFDWKPRTRTRREQDHGDVTGKTNTD